MNAFGADTPSSAPTAPPSLSSHRVEELFIWKISEDLKLTPDEEKKFSKTFKSLNFKKAELNTRLLEIVKSFKGSKTPKEISSKLADYKKALIAYNKISIDEFELLKEQFGPDRFTKYLDLKFDLTNRLKELLMTEHSEKVDRDPLRDTKDKNEKARKPLPPPHIIEE